MWPWLEIMRPGNSALSALGVFIGAFLVASVFDPAVLLGALAVFFITGAGNAVNDIMDVESDRINRPQRPIPSGRIKKKPAIAYTAALFILGLALVVLMNNILCLVLAAVNSLLLIAYSYSLQNKVLMGNIAVAYLAGSVFLFGGAAAGDIALPLLLTILAMLTTFAREIVKDLEDLEGDRKSFLKKITSKMKESFGDRFRIGRSGIKLRYKTIYAILFSSFSLWLAVVVSSVPYMWGLLGITYLVLLVPVDAMLIAASIILIRRRNYRITSKLIKTAMAVGMLAFLVGSIF
ncbi:MAG: UbiA family prenyltransferase [Candidatus Aenigmarchaeota archaeon]|nr:UbiA family prenyltransferase [Candidatus Aenigmarchaeota archaeon]